MSNSINNTLEIAKISITDEHQHFLFKPEVMDDPIDWGYLLADFARLLASSYEESQNSDPNAVLTRILEGFDAEIKSPSIPQESPQATNYSTFK
jgi:hypothetical protein